VFLGFFYICANLRIIIGVKRFLNAVGPSRPNLHGAWCSYVGVFSLHTPSFSISLHLRQSFRLCHKVWSCQTRSERLVFVQDTRTYCRRRPDDLMWLHTHRVCLLPHHGIGYANVQCIRLQLLFNVVCELADWLVLTMKYFLRSCRTSDFSRVDSPTRCSAVVEVQRICIVMFCGTMF